MIEIIDNLSSLTQVFLTALILFIAVFAVSSPIKVESFNRFFFLLKKRFSKEFKEIKTYEDLNNMLKTYGYSYDGRQDIFISNHNAWQREMGYSRLFDEAAAPMSMIIDCEPIYFEYDSKTWLIEFWKGQYGMTTGCEIGVYYTDDKLEDMNIAWYDCADDINMLNMSFTLKKDGKSMMKRGEKHWWLTGFKLGEFSNPEELIMYLNVTLKDRIMRDEFLKGLNKAGYTHNEIIVSGNTIGLKFHNPKTPQPFTRIKETDELTQMKNRLLCDKYREITSDYDNILDKIAAVQRLDPELFLKLFDMGKSRGVFYESPQ